MFNFVHILLANLFALSSVEDIVPHNGGGHTKKYEPVARRK